MKTFSKNWWRNKFLQCQIRFNKIRTAKTYFGKPITSLALLNFSNSFKYSPRAGNIFIQDKIEVKMVAQI